MFGLINAIVLLIINFIENKGKAKFKKELMWIDNSREERYLDPFKTLIL